MATKLRGPALDACPLCGEVKKWYPQHWNRSADCDYPPIGDELHQIVRGILLSDGSLEGSERGKLRVESTSKELAEWLYDQLGHLAGGLRKHRKENPNSDVYRVSSLAHPGLNQYREWYDGRQKRIPDPDCLNGMGMTVFYALDGSLTWGHERQRPRITFKAVDGGYREDLVTMLQTYDPELTVTQGNDHVALSAADTDRFLDSLVGSVPGVEHKWATNQIEYQTLRQSPADHHEYKVKLCITALQAVAESNSGKITPEHFDEQIEVIDSATVADTLGGGDWGDALSVAGVSKRKMPETSRPEDPSPEYTEAETKAALEEWADQATEHTYNTYHEFSKGRADVPSVAWFYDHYDGFRGAVEELTDLALPKAPGTEYWTRERSAQAVAKWIQDCDDLTSITSASYRDFESGSSEYPALSRLYELFDDWNDILSAAAENLSEIDAEELFAQRKRTVKACPDCDSAQIAERKIKTPRYRCGDCGSEFEDPVERDSAY
jgi:ribosomal protein S27AE